MPPTLVPPIEYGLSSSPPICDDKATIGGEEAKAVKPIELEALPLPASRIERFARFLVSPKLPPLCIVVRVRAYGSHALA